MSKDDIPMVTYELQKPVRSKLFSNKKFVESSHQLLYPKLNHLPCHCESSPFIDPAYVQILTEDLRIVRNNKLRKLRTQ